MGPLLSTFMSVAFVGTSLLPTTAPIPVVTSDALLETAYSRLGTPYCRGGSGGKCFDCSGFTSYVYDKHGIDLSKSARQQFKNAQVIAREEAVPGDLVFFKSKSGYIYHVGIYIGDNKIVHAPRYGKRVKEEVIWSNRVVFARVAIVVT